MADEDNCMLGFFSKISNFYLKKIKAREIDAVECEDQMDWCEVLGL